MECRKYKRKALRAKQYQQETGSSLASPKGMIEIKEPQVQGFNENDPKCRSRALMNLIHYAGVMELFKQSIKRFKGTNCILEYKPTYDFSEKWEETSKSKFQRNENIYLAANGLLFMVAMLVMMHKIPMIWFFTTHHIFEIEQPMAWLLIGILFVLIDICLKAYLVYGQIVKNASSQQISQLPFKLSIFSFFLGDILTLLVYFLSLWKEAGNNQPYLIVLDYTVAIIQSYKFLEIYNTLFIFLISYKYKNSINLFGFISKLFIILHVSAIIVYSVSLIDQNKNWLKSINKEDAAPFTKYIYSVYFTGTTMFTVGYGDIIPKNEVEIVVILLIQVLGIVVIGYIISEIGHTLTVMREAQDEFEQDIQNADTIANNYQLSSDLRHKVRNYIVNNRLASQELNVKEEHNLLMKLNEELRSEVNNANHLKIIKTSLFFICNWSCKMQKDVSKKLEKFFFSPNQRIAKLNKIYIVTNGKIDVYTERKSGNKVYSRKHLKTIQRDPKKEVYDNIFGSTSLFTGKPGSLLAVSKDFAVCYALDYADILQIMKDDDKDFEYYHETKSKLQLQHFPEKYEVPNLINNRHHYCPTRYIILRKNKKNLQTKQQRSQKLRSSRKSKMNYLDKQDNHQMASESDSQGENIDNDAIDSLKVEDIDLPKRTKAKQTPSAPLRIPTPLSSNPTCISFRSYKRRFQSKLNEQRAKQQQMKDLLQNNVVVTSQFQIGRQFDRYFKQGNLTNVLMKYSRNSIREFKEVNSKNLRMDWIDLLIFAQKLHQGRKGNYELSQ